MNFYAIYLMRLEYKNIDKLIAFVLIIKQGKKKLKKNKYANIKHHQKDKKN